MFHTSKSNALLREGSCNQLSTDGFEQCDGFCQGFIVFAFRITVCDDASANVERGDLIANYHRSYCDAQVKRIWNAE